MADLYRLAAGEGLRQIPEERQPRHSGAVAVAVIGSPGGFDRMQVSGGERRRKQRMAAVHARIEQADMRHCVVRRPISGPAPQIVEPFLLLVARQGIEEVGGFLWAPQLGDHVERHDGTLHPVGGRVDQQNAAFREFQLSRRRFHPLGSGPPAERGDRGPSIPTDVKPRFPPDRPFVGGGEFFGIVRPKRPQACCANVPDRVDQPPVVAGATGDVPLFRQIVADEVFEVIELAVGHENRGVSAVLFVADVEEFDSRTLPRQALEGEFDIGEAPELDLEAQPLLDPGRPLRFPRRLRVGSKRIDLPPQVRAMPGAVLRRNRLSPSPDLPRGTIGFGPGNAFENEVPALLVASVRHVAGRSLSLSVVAAQPVGDALAFRKHRQDIRFADLVGAAIHQRVL